MAAKFFGIDCQVFMVKASYDQKPYRRYFMELFGAEVVPSPSPTTQAGKAILDADPDSTGSLGIAISEAVEVAATSGGAGSSAPCRRSRRRIFPSSAWDRRPALWPGTLPWRSPATAPP